MLKHIVLFGAGKSSGFLIEYLLGQLTANQWQLTIADNNPKAVEANVSKHPFAGVRCLNAEEADLRRQLISEADIVISLLPPRLHSLVATDCLDLGRHLLTASYIYPQIQALESKARQKGLLFLCEMGLDPGIDHMSAMRALDRLRNQGARIVSFQSYCGGLVASANDNNPWRYKISWNPRNVVLAGKQGARFFENNRETTIDYQELFDPERRINVPGLGELSWYPNRDSLEYRDKYLLSGSETFIRATLRYPSFCAGWKQLVMLNFTSEEIQYDTDGMTLGDFFHEHLRKYRAGMTDERWLVKSLAATPGFYAQLKCLGLYDNTTRIDKGRCTAASILQFALEQKLVLHEHEKDLIAMLHHIGYELEGRRQTLSSCLLLEGENGARTAIAKTVGLPLAVATVLILRGKIEATGLCIPILPEIYEPVLAELENCGINFREQIL